MPAVAQFTPGAARERSAARWIRRLEKLPVRAVQRRGRPQRSRGPVASAAVTSSSVDAEPEPATPPRPRRGAVVALVVVGVLLLVAGVSHVLLGSYDPRLTLVDQEVQAPAAVQPLRVAGRDVSQLEYVDREELRVALTLDNDGRLPVTITDASPDGPTARRLMQAFAVTGLADGDAAFEPGAATSGDSVGVGAGDRRVVVVRLRFTDCEFISSRSSSLLNAVTLRYRTLWRSGEVTVPLRTTYRASSPRDLGCPRSTLDTRPPG